MKLSLHFFLVVTVVIFVQTLAGCKKSKNATPPPVSKGILTVVKNWHVRETSHRTYYDTASKKWLYSDTLVNYLPDKSYAFSLDTPVHPGGGSEWVSAGQYHLWSVMGHFYYREIDYFFLKDSVYTSNSSENYNGVDETDYFEHEEWTF